MYFANGDSTDPNPHCSGWIPPVPATPCMSIITHLPLYPFISPTGTRATVDSSFYPEDSFRHGNLRPSRSQPATSLTVQPPAVRPLSSADETGPAAKKPRSGTRQRTVPPSSTATDTNIRPSKSAGVILQGADDRSKSSKARARPALTLANIFSSPGRRAQHAATSSRSNLTGVTKAVKELPPGPTLTRRSTRLLSGPSSKTTLAPKVGDRLIAFNIVKLTRSLFAP